MLLSAVRGGGGVRGGGEGGGGLTWTIVVRNMDLEVSLHPTPLLIHQV